MRYIIVARALLSDTMSLLSFFCLGESVRVCAREQRVTVFGEVYDAKLAFLFTQSQDQLFSVAILKFFFPYCGYLLINVEWANERTLLHKCGFHMQAKIIFVI